MSRSEYDANMAMKPKSYAEGWIACERAMRNREQRKRDEAAKTALYMWAACFASGLAIGLMWGAL